MLLRKLKVMVFLAKLKIDLSMNQRLLNYEINEGGAFISLGLLTNRQTRRPMTN